KFATAILRRRQARPIRTVKTAFTTAPVRFAASRRRTQRSTHRKRPPSQRPIVRRHASSGTTRRRIFRDSTLTPTQEHVHRRRRFEVRGLQEPLARPLGPQESTTNRQLRRYPMLIRLLRAGLPGLGIALVPMTSTIAHEIVGNRFFPATIGIDDPGV